MSVGEAEVVIERRSVNQRKNMLDICCVVRGWSSGRDTCKLYRVRLHKRGCLCYM